MLDLKPIFHPFSKSFLLTALALVLGLSSCQETVWPWQNVEGFYSNDFSKLDLENFENGRLFIFLGDTLLGNYHNEEVSVTVPGLPNHNMLRITIELWIHDSWDGNIDEGISGPDIWYMKIDDEEIFRTTFSNSPCESTFCLRQSYPAPFRRQNLPKTDAIRTSFPGLCSLAGVPNYTSVYRISKLVHHDDTKVKITLGDELKQTNAADPKCDESWSVGKIEVSSIFAF